MVECLVNRGILVDAEGLQDTECPASIGLVNAERRLQRDRITSVEQARLQHYPPRQGSDITN